ncbi:MULTISPECIES: PspC domain-containing protein [Fructobacillus]|uniref:PspC domain-containing protein n=1 Tax=Fructobacillus TaxID=559173 RepID=UPI00165895C8|nr:PspC domain-containing protein [Fructobacillus fructosus]MBC9119299.1 PspC domain-containing protein [Fructobacillus fructosus]MBD9366874.1 PspC domain-containing protein [Leuconostoc mesenteroides]CAK1253071.1 Phage shock protein PspC (stress-responsive transcriptional regulator) (PspC) [Fructobacillus tropaeoli]
MKITRSTSNRWIAGVLGGIAERYNWNANVLRLLFVVLSLTPFPGIIVYLVLWLIMPDDHSSKKDDVFDGEIID